MKFIVNVTSQIPLSFRSGRSDTDTSTLPYIPGSAVLGGLAHAHTLLHPEPKQTAQFEQFFLQKACFSNLYPADSPKWGRKENEKAYQILNGEDLPVYPLPNTARSCKRFSGFQFDKGKNDNQHGVFDHLFDWLLFELSGQTHIKSLENHKLCSHIGCEEAMDRIEGFYRRGFNSNEYGQPKAKEILRTRTGINRATGTVQPQILYSRVVLAENSKFWGTIEIGDENADDFETFVDTANDAGLIRVGNNRTRGLGHINLSLSSQPVNTDSEQIDLVNRLKQFNTKLQAKAKTTGIALNHSFYAPLHFTADTILLDHLLRPLTDLTADYLRETCRLGHVEVVYRNYHTRRVMSWNNLWRLPKADDLAITMGSIFVVGFNRPADDNLYQTLLNLQRNGLGQRRAEGFGQLLIANPFHWEVQNI